MWFSLYKQLYSVPEDLDKVNILPLHHSHNGQTCPISIKNQKKIDTIKQQISQIEQNETHNILECRNNLEKAVKHYNQVKHDWDRLGSPDFGRDTTKITQIEHNITNLMNQLKSLPQLPNYEQKMNDLKHHILALQHKQRDLKNAVPIGLEQEEQIALIRHSTKNDIDNINDRIGQLRDMIARLGEKPKAPADVLKNIDVSIRDGISRIETDFNTQSAHINKKYQDTRAALEAKQREHSRKNDVLVDDISRLEAQLRHLTNICNDAKQRADNLPKTPQYTNKWNETRIAAENEIENVKAKIALFKTASAKEVQELDAKNNAILAGLRKEFDVNKTNEAIALRELRGRINHDKANTSVEMTYGTQQALPITSFVVEPRREVVIQATEVMVPTLVPKTALVKTSESSYYRDRDLSVKPYTSNVKYHEYPDVVQRDVIHDTSVPKVTVELKKRVEEVKQETIVRKPVTKKIIEEVVQEQVEVKPVKIKVTYQELVGGPTTDVTTKTTQTHHQTSTSHRSTGSSSDRPSETITTTHYHAQPAVVTDRSHTISTSHGTEFPTKVQITTTTNPRDEKSWGDVINPLKWFT